MGQHYLLYEQGARPLTYRQTAELLASLQPDANWTQRRIEHRIEHRIAALRHRLGDGGCPYPLAHDTDGGAPWDNNLLHNLLTGLVESTTLVPPDLQLMDQDFDD
jgi:hypothetical protein